MKQLGIIIPCFNCENTIDRCIQSIINQKQSEECEIILINDGSTDNTNEVLQKYSNRDGFIIYNQKNQGASIARNKGIELCSCEYIMFVDSDDMLFENSLEVIFSNLNKYHNSLTVYGINQEFYKDDKLIKTSEIKSNENECINLKAEKHKIIKYLENNLLNGPYSKIFSLKIIKDNKIRFKKNLKIQEDLCFNMEYLSKIEKLFLNDKLIYRYFMLGKQSITSKFLPERFDNYRYVENVIFSYFENEDNCLYLKELYYIAVKNTWSAIINTFYPGNNFSIKKRKKFIMEILDKCNFDIINQAERIGIKYLLLKKVLLSKNICLIYIVGKLLSIIKKNLYINYK